MSELRVYSWWEYRHYLAHGALTETQQTLVNLYPSPAQEKFPDDVCPICGGCKFLRADVAPGHYLFGALICCPNCWPAPLGANEDKYIENPQAQAWAQAASARHAKFGIRIERLEFGQNMNHAEAAERGKQWWEDR